MKCPSREHYVETVFEILDERDWETIDWEDSDRADFAMLLREAWERAAKHEVEDVGEIVFTLDPDAAQTLCGKCGQPFTYPVGCRPDKCLEESK